MRTMVLLAVGAILAVGSTIGLDKLSLAIVAWRHSVAMAEVEKALAGKSLPVQKGVRLEMKDMTNDQLRLTVFAAVQDRDNCYKILEGIKELSEIR